MRSRFTLLFLLAAISLMPLSIFAQTGNKLPKINIKEYRLKNGLRVVFHQDKSTPVVAVNVWYHVGSKNEAPGRTGFAHLFEHMMFQGSKNYGDGYLGAMDEAGANVNGTTNEDRTYYYEVVPSNFLERALYLEADRMGGLLDAMSQEKLDNQRDVVKNERRQRVDNQPYGTEGEKIGAIMYPKGHPYNWSVIGSMEDLGAASLDDIKSFFRTYYVPNNAVLVLAGSFDEAQAKTWIKKYFGPIAKGADVSRPTPAQPALDKEVRVVVEDAVPLSRISMVWHSVPQFAGDEAALDILGNILSSGRGSRLQSNLVYGKEIAQNIFANNGTNEIAGVFQVTALAKQGKSLDDIEKEVNIELERIKKDPPTADEMTRALNGIESQTIFRLQTVLGKGGQLSNFVGYRGKPDYFQEDLDRYRKVTAADVQRVAAKYLTANRLVMSYVPRKGAGPAGNPNANKPTSTEKKKKDDALLAKQKAALPKPGPNPSIALPAIEKTKLSNGLNVWIVKQNELPIVSMNLVLNTGGTLDPADKSGVSSFTANMLNQGTKTRSANDIANQLQSIGASVGAQAGWDSTNVSMQSLTKDLDQALGIYADVVVNPTFPNAEFESNRRRLLGQLFQRKSNPTAVSDVVYNKVLYGDQPYGRQLSGDEKSVKAFTRDDLANFYAKNYGPSGNTLIVVGDVETKTLMPKLEKAFEAWKSGGSAAMAKPDSNMMGKPGVYLVDKPGAAQSSVSIGQVGVDRANPDYYAVQVMNAILGGGGGARLFMNLREDKGYTYGAYSRFTYRRGAGPFAASAEVQTGSTKESIVEFMKELNGIRGSIPVSNDELETNKQSLIRRFPSGFETVGQISGQLANLVVYGLSDAYFNEYIPNVNAVTVQDVNRVANKYLDPTKMAIVIVGDRKVIEPGLKELGYPLTILDADGNPAAQ
ncbi:MAG TPA: pitrilysin family protein [Pyrinomonadaceae bacterium]|nr:insulinase family protein [Chloracidobacterium sp.]MBP9934178.1 insulinase family protein [Pyrinomonadaceae bacterium]MBK9436940.1 insulinase family protein [Chloracidobacterium sp.]MBL0241934.1 insulinase family protein [Chloracidobacterium sp.]HQX54614.1 pitrilysin family protein [Pyrinomonadaceae bacterium]